MTRIDTFYENVEEALYLTSKARTTLGAGELTHGEIMSFQDVAYATVLSAKHKAMVDGGYLGEYARVFFAPLLRKPLP